MPQVWAPIRTTIVVAALLAATTGAAPGQSAAPTYFESLTDLDSGDTLSFVAFGRQFSVELAPNDSIIGRLAADDRRSVRDVRLYRGHLTGIADSWVRLTRRGRSVRALIWDGQRYYAISDHPESASDRENRYIIYEPQSADSRPFDRVVLPPTYGATTLRATSGGNPALMPGRQMDIGLIADFEMYSREGDGTAAELLSIANIVDGIFVDQLGLHLNIAELDIQTVSPGPFSTSDAEILLEELTTYKAATPALTNLGIAHLFTGRDLSDVTTPGGEFAIFGIAMLSSVCDPRFGASLTEAADTATSALIAAHEIGHNLGAPHDGEADSACAAEPQTFLMSPTITNTHQFSECSIGQMLPEIVAAACVGDIPPNDMEVLPRLLPAESVAYGKSVFGDAIIANRGLNDAYGVYLTVSADGFNQLDVNTSSSARYSCEANDDRTTYYCYLYSLAAETETYVSFRATAAGTGTGTITISVTSLNDTNEENNSHTYEVDIIPSVEFETISTSATPDVIRLGETAEVTLEFVNLGLDDATSTVAIIDVSTWYEVLSITTPSGEACTPDPIFTNRWRCPLGTVPSNVPQSITLVIEAAPRQELAPGDAVSGSITLKLEADQPNLGHGFGFSPVIITPTLSDLQISIDGPQHVVENEWVTVTLTAQNVGPDPADDIEITLSHAFAFAYEDVVSDGIDCVVEAIREDRIRCHGISLAPGGSTVIAVSGSAAQSRSYGYDLNLNISGKTYDANNSNNYAHLLMNIGPAPPPSQEPSDPEPPPVSTPDPGPTPIPTSGGGGGGSTGIFVLAALGFALGMRRRRTCAVEHVARQSRTASGSVISAP